MTSTNGTVTATPKKGPHITHVERQSISKLAPFSALIISIIFICYFLIRFYILEKFLLKRIYGKKYTELNDTARRGFVNHHIAGATKIVILLIAAYPFIYVIAKGDFHSRLIGFITMGDVLIVAAQM
jgi:hypothetical protein